MSHTLRECLLLIPSSGLDDFPESLPTSDSEQVLSAWLALWHPRLLAQTHASPRWQSANQPPHSFEGILALAPDCTAAHLPSDLHNTARNAGGWLIKPASDWRAVQQLLLQTLDLSDQPPVLPDLQTEFAALGYAYLQIQLLTQKLRYSSNLDQILFDSQVDQAASAALSGDVGQAEQFLQSCFDQLGQERDHYYSLDVNLLDVTLLAESTLGPSVGKQLDRPLPTTFVASASLLRQMKSRHPQVATQLQQALTDHRASLAGGLDLERPHPLMTFDSLKRDLDRGHMAYRELGFQPPTVFTRFSFGQVSDMPLHLRRSGYAGCMLIAWQEGDYPSGSHAKFSWEAAEGTFINAIAPPLVDALSPATYLTLGRRIADALDHQHVPVFMMAHWPNQYSNFFELLERVVRRTPALGRWQNIDDFFEKTDQPYHQDSLPGRKFVYDWAAAAGSNLDSFIDATVAYHRLSASLQQLRNVLNLSYQLENFHQRSKPAPTVEGEDPNRITAVAERGPQAVELDTLDRELVDLIDRVDALLDNPSDALTQVASIDTQLNDLQTRLDARLARAAGHKPIVGSSAARPTGYLLTNPCSAPQRLSLRSDSQLSPVVEVAKLPNVVEVAKLPNSVKAAKLPNSVKAAKLPNVVEAAKLPNAGAGGSWLYATGCDSQERLSMIDLPCFGMLPVSMQSASSPSRKREQTLVQGDGLLVNDFMEIQIDPRTGALRSLHAPGKRGNRLSMQLARRERTSAGVEYSQMQVTQVRTLENSPVRGLVRASGKCLLGNEPTASFEIDYELLRGHRVLTVDVKLSALTKLSGSPWSSAYVLRTAWPSEAGIVSTRSCSSRQSFPSGKAIATEWIEIDDVEYRTYLLTAGLPFHHRVEERFMETLLGNGSTGQLRRKIGIGIDLPNASIAALQFGQPAHAIPLQSVNASTAAAGAATWLMHVDAKNVLMQLYAPLVDEAGNCAGMRVHVSELAGKSVTARIGALREVREAHRVDYVGNRIAKLTVEGDTTSIAIRPHEMTFVDIEWAMS